MQASTSKKPCRKGTWPCTSKQTSYAYSMRRKKNAEKTVDLLGIFMSATLSWTQMDLKE